MKKFYLFLFTAFAVSPLYTQDCSDCGNRSVSVYNLKITGMSPTAGDHAAIMNYFNAVMVGQAITQYLTTADPSAGCIQVSSYDLSTVDSSWALQYPSYLAQLGSSFKESPSGETPDYWIGGTVEPKIVNTSWMVTYQFDLKTKNNEIVASASGNTAFYPGGNVYNSVAASMASMSPIYDKIKDFEVKKRDSGEPYAIDPKLECTWKNKLEFGEKTKINFTFKDCDGEVLKQRKVTVDECTLGELDKMEFTTDDNGKAELEYTAPDASAGIAEILLSYTYAEPWENPENKKSRNGTVEIEIKVPQDSWSLYVTYRYTEDVNWQQMQSDGYTASGQSHTAQSSSICAWIKKKIIPYVPESYFVAELTPIAMNVSGHGSVRGKSNSLWTNPVGYIKNESWHNTFADIASGIIPKYNISINDNELSFSFTKMNATQYGSYNSKDESYDPINGEQSSSESSDADPTTALNWSTNGFVRDTNYSYFTDDGINSSQHNFTQTCTWTDTLLKFTAGKDFVDEINYDTTIVTEDGSLTSTETSKKFTKIRITVEMEYNEGTPDGIAMTPSELPTEYKLFQNYPNPFNPATTINYSVGTKAPSSNNGNGWVSVSTTLKIYDVMGREVTTLVNETQSPGNYSVQFDGSKLSSGMYFYVIKAGSYTATKKLVLMK
jgi:hypothetical protein